MSFHTKPTLFLLAAFSAILLLNACHNYYMATPTRLGTIKERAATVDSLRLADRYFILRNGSEFFYMSNAILNQDHKTLECILDSVSPYNKLHLTNGRKGKMQYQKSTITDLNVLNEVHFYIAPDTVPKFGKYTLDLNKVQKIEVIEKDKKRTTNSYVIGALGYTIGALAVVTIIIAATKSSCPFVSAYTGNEFTLQGEIYGGAIYPQLARHDYMPLKIEPLSDGSLQVKISNELHEHQYTDIAELWIITHSKNGKVLSDETGNLYTVSAPQPPTVAWLNEKKEVTASLLKAGDNAMLYLDDTVSTTNEVVMQFNKPLVAKKANLLLTLKNSYFLDLLYGELAKGFGSYYGTYIKQQEKKPVAELLQWTRDQKIPLEVSVKTNSGWKKITGLTTIGPLATRNIVVPVEFPETTEPFTQIKLSSGFMFWEIDYAALDFSDQNDFTIQKITASKATDELGKNILADLQKEDAVYLSQPDIGNVVTLTYNAEVLQDNSKTRTYLLHTKGYYEHIRDFKNSPDVNFLNQFKKPGAFPLFGMSVYKKMAAENMKTLVKSN